MSFKFQEDGMDEVSAWEHQSSYSGIPQIPVKKSTQSRARQYGASISMEMSINLSKEMFTKSNNIFAFKVHNYK